MKSVVLASAAVGVAALAIGAGAGIAATAAGRALKLVAPLAVLGAITAAVTGVGAGMDVDVDVDFGEGVAGVSAGLPIIWRMACKKTLLSGMMPTTPSGSKT